MKGEDFLCCFICNHILIIRIILDAELSNLRICFQKPLLDGGVTDLVASADQSTLHLIQKEKNCLELESVSRKDYGVEDDSVVLEQWKMYIKMANSNT